MIQTTDELIRDYLDDLDAELAELPRAARREVVAEISAHIDELRSELRSEGEPDVRELLDRVGDPADIAADARERFGIQPRKRTWVEVTALVLLSIGSLVIPVVGWLIGVVLLWISEVWSTRDKLLGTFVIPGGIGGLWCTRSWGRTAKPVSTRNARAVSPTRRSSSGSFCSSCSRSRALQRSSISA